MLFLPTRRHCSFELPAGVLECWIPVGIIVNISTGYYTKLSVSIVSNKSSMQNYPECNSIMLAKNITTRLDCRSLKDRWISKITISILRRPVLGEWSMIEKTVKCYLITMGVIYIFLGLWCAVLPQKVSTAVGFELQTGQGAVRVLHGLWRTRGWNWLTLSDSNIR